MDPDRAHDLGEVVPVREATTPPSPEQPKGFAGKKLNLLKKMDDEYKLLDEEFLKFMRLVNNAAAQPDELHKQMTDLIKQRDPRKTDFQTTVSRTLSLKSQLEQAIAQLEAQQQAILDGIAKIK